MTIEIYGSVENADTFFADIEVSGTWGSYNDTEKESALAKATVQIDRLPFVGMKYSNLQVRQFPRLVYYNNRVLYLDVDLDGEVVVPEAVEHAVYAQAKFLLDYANDESIIAITKGITSQSIGATSESYNQDMLPIDPKTGICREAKELITPYLFVGY